MFTNVLKMIFTSILIVMLLSSLLPAAQGVETQVSALQQLSIELAAKLDSMRTPLYYQLLAETTGVQGYINADPEIVLQYIDDNGFPVFCASDNINSAKTISSDDVWPGGTTGFNLSGSNTPFGKLGIWEMNNVYLTNWEFYPNKVQKFDLGGPPRFMSDHATHVAGTMIARGFIPELKGMSYESFLSAYDQYNDIVEMTDAAINGMNVSNHSYGKNTGWVGSLWVGNKEISTIEDYTFGFYDFVAYSWDKIAYYAPYYTIVKTAGNDRDDSNTNPTSDNHYWDNTLNQWKVLLSEPEPDGGTDGYDCIPTYGNSKNIITVGAVHGIPSGYEVPSDVVMSVFSSWGPTDDGRIKPDIVANGVNVRSPIKSYSDSVMNGTSMAAPSVAGSINLLVRHFENTHNGETPLASTMKAVVLHTSDEAGTADGPDYQHGWGLMNTAKAAQIIADDGTYNSIIETILNDGDTDYYKIYSDGIDPVRLTIVWTDPPGTPVTASLNPPDLMLVNDLDMRLSSPSHTNHKPYILDPANPANAATTGDNFRDNVEQIYVDSPEEGFFLVSINHKNNITNGVQPYSLVSSHTLTTIELTDVYVDVTNGDDVTGDGSETNPYASIDKGIDEATFASTVWVKPGTYYENAISFNGKRITVKATALPGADSTEIRPTSCAFKFFNDERPSSIVDGFLIKGGVSGVQCFNAAPTITHCVFQNQTGYNIYGAINLWGDVIDSDGHSPAVIVNNTITGSAGSGIQDHSKSPPTIKNNIIQNCGSYGINLEIDAVMKPGYQPLLSYNNVWNNGTNYSTSITGNGTGSISAMPLMIGNHIAVTSPCVDAGDPDPIYNDPDDTRNDMGAIPSCYPPPKVGGEILFKDGESNKLVPASFALHQNYPNPFNPTTEISFALPYSTNVTLEIFNLLGQHITTLTDKYYNAGVHVISWNATEMTSGIYFYRITAGSFKEEKKMILLK